MEEQTRWKKEKKARMQLDPFVGEAEYSINTLNIKLPYLFVFEAVDVNWHDLFIAIENGYLSHQSAVDFARLNLSDDGEFDENALEIATLTPEKSLFSHSIHPYIEELAEKVTEENKQRTKQKLMYLVLKWVLENKTQFEDPLEVVETIYADFGYPAEIAHFVRYMPMTEPVLESLELNIARIYDKWSKFVKKQEILFAPRI